MTPELKALQTWLDSRVRQKASDEYNRGFNDALLDMRLEIRALSAPPTPPVTPFTSPDAETSTITR